MILTRVDQLCQRDLHASLVVYVNPTKEKNPNSPESYCFLSNWMVWKLPDLRKSPSTSSPSRICFNLLHEKGLAVHTRYITQIIYTIAEYCWRYCVTFVQGHSKNSFLLRGSGDGWAQIMTKQKVAPFSSSWLADRWGLSFFSRATSTC